MGGSNPVFVGGPCVTTPDRIAVEVFARSGDGRVLRRASDGSTWGNWTNLPALDARLIDARSDLDCSATLTSVHVVASGLNPPGAVVHAFGFGTAYNPFIRELPGLTFVPSPSIAVENEDRFFLGMTAPGLFEFERAAVPKELTPITTQTDTFRGGPDIALQPAGGSGLHYFATFDATGTLVVHCYVMAAGGSDWATPVRLSPPAGSFAFSPAICTEIGAYGVFSVNVVAVAGGAVWYARTSSIASPFSPWTMISNDSATAPDCAVAGEADSIVHVVTLSAAGTVLDIHGKETSWVVTDLGGPL